jgi:hypothetical protein
MANVLNETVCGKLAQASSATVGDLSVKRFNRLAMVITTLNGETISVYPSFDNGTTFSPSKLAFALITTPATCTVVDLTNATYQATYMPACTHLRFVKSAGTNPVLIQYTLSTT